MRCLLGAISIRESPSKVSAITNYCQRGHITTMAPLIMFQNTKCTFFRRSACIIRKKTVPFFCGRSQDSAHSPASFPAPPFVHIFAAKSKDMDFTFFSIEPLPNAKSAMSASSKSTAWRCFYSCKCTTKRKKILF